jgi:hypothetical protein
MTLALRNWHRACGRDPELDRQDAADRARLLSSLKQIDDELAERGLRWDGRMIVPLTVPR